MSTEKLSVAVRPARPEDTPQAMELTAQIWGGHDYVPRAWGTWLADPEGGLLVAESEGRLVGLAKVSRQTSGEGWLHGLRVHPRFEGRGVASALHEASVAAWDARGGGPLRLATRSDRYPVQHLCNRTGFEKTGEFTWYVASPLAGLEPGRIAPLPEDQAPGALQTLLESPALGLSWGLVAMSWEWERPSEHLLREAAARGKAWQWNGEQPVREGLLLLGEDDEDEEHLTSILLTAACSLEGLPELLLDYRRLAQTLGYARPSWAAPLRPELEPVLAGAGFARDWDHSVFLYTRM